MSLIPRLVVAYDFSDPARRAFELGLFLGRQLGAEVHVVTVLDPSDSKDASGEPRRLDDLKKLLELQTRDAVRDDELQMECHAVAGEPAGAIVTVARRIDAPLILCGTTGKGAVARTLLGSVSHELVHHSGAIADHDPGPTNGASTNGANAAMHGCGRHRARSKSGMFRASKCEMNLTQVGGKYRGFLYEDAPRNVYWETTIACDLACQHCRASAIPHRDPKELTTEEGRALIRSVKDLGSMLVLTGGDPLKRPDISELIGYGRDLGIHVAITPSTTASLDLETMRGFRDLGVSAMGVSLDGPTAELHDGFRNVQGTFDYSMRALKWARALNIPVQVNTTITAQTLPHVPAIYRLLRDEAAPPVRRWSLFLLVPVGRGEELGVPAPGDVERLFEWVYSTSADAPFRISTTEAPHYRRYWIQRKLEDGVSLERIHTHARPMGFGIRDGNGVIFVSHRGDVYPAGFLPHPLLGNVRDKSLADLYRHSPALQRLRDPANYTGRCGRCEFKWVCGGSRARAFAVAQDVFGADPLCAYEPVGEPS